MRRVVRAGLVSSRSASLPIHLAVASSDSARRRATLTAAELSARLRLPIARRAILIKHLYDMPACRRVRQLKEVRSSRQNCARNFDSLAEGQHRPLVPPVHRRCTGQDDARGAHCKDRKKGLPRAISVLLLSQSGESFARSLRKIRRGYLVFPSVNAANSHGAKFPAPADNSDRRAAEIASYFRGP